MHYCAQSAAREFKVRKGRHTELYKEALGAPLAAKVRPRARIYAQIANSATEQGITTNHDIVQRFNRADTATSHGISRLRRHQEVIYSAVAPLATSTECYPHTANWLKPVPSFFMVLNWTV